MQSEVRELKSSLVATSEEKEKFKVSEHALRTEVSLLEKQLQSARAAGSDRDQRLVVQSQAAHAYEMELDKAKSELAALKSEYARTSASSNEKITRLETQLENEAKQRKSAEAKANEKKANTRDLQSKLRIQRATSASLKEEMQESQRRTSEYRAHIQRSQKEHTRLEEELDAITGELNAKREQHSNVSHELEKCSLELSKSKIAVENLRDSLREKSKELKAKEDELNSLALEMTEKVHQIEESKRVVSRTREQVGAVQQHLGESRQALASAEQMHMGLLEEMKKMYSGGDAGAAGAEVLLALETELAEARRAMGIVDEVSEELQSSSKTLAVAEASLGGGEFSAVESKVAATTHSPSSQKAGDLVSALKQQYEALLTKVQEKARESDIVQSERIESLEQDIRNKEQQIDELRADVVKHAQDLVDARAAIEHAEKKRDFEETSKRSFAARVEAIEASIKTLNESAHIETKSHSAAIASLQENVERMEEAMFADSAPSSMSTESFRECFAAIRSSLSGESDMFSQEIASYQKLFEALNLDVQRVRKEVRGDDDVMAEASMYARTTGALTDLELLRKRHAKSLRKMEAQIERLAADCMSATRTQEKLEKELSKAKQDAKLEEEILREKVAASERSALEAKERETTATASVEKLMREQSDLASALAEEKVKSDNLEARISELRGSVLKEARSDDSAAAATEVLSTELDAMRQKVKNLEASLKASRKKNWDAEKESRAAYVALERKLEDSQSEVSVRKKECAALERRLERAVYDPTRANDGDARCEDIVAEMSRLRKERSDLMMMSAGNSSQLSDAEEARSELSHQITTLQSELILRTALNTMESSLRSQMMEAARDSSAADDKVLIKEWKQEAKASKRAAGKIKRVLALHEERMKEMRASLHAARASGSGTEKRAKNLESELAAAERTEARLHKELSALTLRLSEAEAKVASSSTGHRRSKRDSLEVEKRLRGEIEEVTQLKSASALIAEGLHQGSPHDEPASSSQTSRRRATVATAHDAALPLKYPFQRLTSRRRLSAVTKATAEMRVVELEEEVKRMTQRIRELESNTALTEILKREGTAEKNSLSGSSTRGRERYPLLRRSYKECRLSAS